MKQIINLSKEASNCLMQASNLVATKDGSYLYFPYWMKLTDKEGVFEILKWDDLPSDLKSFIQEKRNQALIPKQKIKL